jgi:hypothetical protein
MPCAGRSEEAQPLPTGAAETCIDVGEQFCPADTKY